MKAPKGDVSVSLRKNVWRGRTEDELKQLSIDDFMALVDARARRTLKRRHSFPAYMNLINKVRKLKKEGKIKPNTLIKTRVRDAVILPEWLGLTFGVYNGKEYKAVKITVDHLGHRLGEFAHTTGIVKHSGPGIGATRGSKFVSAK